MSALGKVFKNLKKEGKSALIGYVTGGDPNPASTKSIAEALVNGGVDILELGIPFSDPIADGPSIQAASLRALTAGTTPKRVLEMAGEIRKKRDVPVVILTYFNSIFKMGIQTFFRKARSSLVDGVVVPDLPLEEAGDYIKAAKACEINTIFLAAPSTTNNRLENIITSTSGFLYVVSHFGVTGERKEVEASTLKLVRRISQKAKGRIPVAVGFGISRPEHVKTIIEAGADGVIVGSAFVNVIQQNQGKIRDMCMELEELARQLKAGTF